MNWLDNNGWFEQMADERQKAPPLASDGPVKVEYPPAVSAGIAFMLFSFGLMLIGAAAMFACTAWAVVCRYVP